ncbi:hypothetical protein GOODEAATRI_020286 [Goodea atripinnis]|uniref:Uncharacterized protein n=1 Tax=Goodea atripinnis TaxID=208336 RepID=A0ABV0NYV0_9TELE
MSSLFSKNTLSKSNLSTCPHAPPSLLLFQSSPWSGSVSSSFYSSSSPLCTNTPASFSIRKGFSVCLPLSESLSDCTSVLLLPALNDFSLLCDRFVYPASLSLVWFPPVYMQLFLRVTSSPLFLRHGSVHAAGESVTDETACLSMLTCAVLPPALFACCCCKAAIE